MVWLDAEILHLPFVLMHLNLKSRRSKTSFKRQLVLAMTSQKGNKTAIDAKIHLVKLARQRSDSTDKDVLGNAIQNHPARI